MPSRSKRTKALRLAIFAGILAVELGFVAAFYVVPQFEARNASLGRWEMETPFNDALWLPFILIAFFSVFALANIGLLITIWRAVKDLKASD